MIDYVAIVLIYHYHPPGSEQHFFNYLQAVVIYIFKKKQIKESKRYYFQTLF